MITISVAAILALIVFKLMNKSNSNRRHNHTARFTNKQIDLLELLQEQLSKVQNVEECDATKVE